MSKNDLVSKSEEELRGLESTGKIFLSPQTGEYKLAKQLIPISDNYFPL